MVNKSIIICHQYDNFWIKKNLFYCLQLKCFTIKLNLKYSLYLLDPWNFHSHLSEKSWLHQCENIVCNLFRDFQMMLFLLNFIFWISYLNLARSRYFPRQFFHQSEIDLMRWWWWHGLLYMYWQSSAANSVSPFIVFGLRPNV